MRRVLLTGIVFASLAMEPASSGDWMQWRGPNHNNVAEAGQTTPTSWSATSNVIWKAGVPGRGHSSPIVFGDIVALTSSDEQGQRQAVVAFDRKSGKELWLTQISQGGFPKVHDKNTHASPSPATDGTLIFATFCHHEKVEAVALDLKGKVVWRTDVGAFRPKLYEYGYAGSPTLYDGTLIVSGDCDTVAWIKALDVKTGKIVWEQPRQLMLNWGSPIVGVVAGREQMLLSGTNKIASYDPKSGSPLWEAPCLTMATCGTVIWDGDIVFASGGYPDPETAAVLADGSGKVLWTNRVKCYEQSMLAHQGNVYAFSDNGIVFCWDGKTGQERWSKRLGGPVSASPLLVGDTIYVSNEQGSTWAIKATPEKYTEIARSQLGDSQFASLIAADNKLFIRAGEGNGPARKETLYCVGNP